MIWLIDVSLLVVIAAGLAALVLLPWPGVVGLLVLMAAWLALTRRGREARLVTALGLGTLGRRLGPAAVIVVGIAGVVGVLVALLAMAEGYDTTLRKSGTADTAIVLRGASGSEVTSVLGRPSIDQIVQAPGVARDAAGTPIASADIVVAADLPLRSGADGSVQVRGVDAPVWALRPQVRIVSGRRFQPGLRELIVGQSAAKRFAGLVPGQSVRLGAQSWTVVGIFASDNAMDSEIWSDAGVVADAYRRGSTRTAVTVRLTSPQAFDSFKRALEANAQLKVDTFTTLDYFGRQSETMTHLLEAIGLVVGSIMAIGAGFGALNTMFTAVSMRAREIATLRAVGFRGLPVVVAVMIEAMLLALLGGVAGGLAAYLVFNGYAASTLAAGSVGQLDFDLRVSPELLWMGAKWALAIGFAGGLFPAVRAARMPIGLALRES